MAADFSVVLDELDTTLRSIEAVLDVDRLRREVAELEQQASAPDLWNDVEAAQALTAWMLTRAAARAPQRSTVPAGTLLHAGR